MNQPFDKYIDNCRKIVFLSPHYDDIVLSCGGIVHLLKNRCDLFSINLFTQSNWGPNIANRSELSVSISEIRKCEDDHYCDRYQISKTDLSYLDSSLRGYDDLSELACEGGDPSLTEKLRKEIAAQLEDLQFDWLVDLLVCPLAIGGHIDHMVVFHAVQKLDVKNVIYYEDLPYVCVFNQNEIHNLLQTRLGDDPDSICVDITDVIQKKVDDIQIYQSQLEAELITKVVEYSSSIVKGRNCERIWYK